MDPGLLHRVTIVERKLDVEFKNKLLLLEALTHRSYLNEAPMHPTGHNERLEFLGDAVVEIVVTEMLFRRYPNEPEGKLTPWRSNLVRGDTLGSIAESLGVIDVMLFSRGQLRQNAESDKTRKRICMDVFEAIIGAIYVDNGYNIGECRLVLDHFLHSRLKTIVASYKDEKCDFQDLAQARFGITPIYRILSETGKMHEKIFTTGAYLGEVLVAQAEGTSKREAEYKTAKTANESITQWEGRIVENGTSDSTMRRSKNGDRQ